MNAFQSIIQKYYGQNKIFYLTKANSINSLDFLQYIYDNKCIDKTKAAVFFYNYILQLFVEEDDAYDFIYKKFNELKKLVVNPFMSNTMVEELLTDFSGFQKIYYGFTRLAHIYKVKKAKVQINTDLCMNELNPKNSNVFVLLQNNLKYYFSGRDLINMININLSKCSGFAPDSIITKNPYNNVVLDETCLYNIYFFLRWNAYAIPELIHGYFNSNFNMEKFRDDYESNIINSHIKNYIYTSHHDTLYPIFEDMWDHYYKITKKIIIDKDFPKDKLINVMKPYLHLYYTSLYATNGTYKQCKADYILRRKLMRFRNYNSSFGRKYIRIKKSICGKRSTIEDFNFKHVNFYNGNSFNNNQSREIELNHELTTGSQNMFVRFYGILDSLRYLPNPTRVPSPNFEPNNDSSLGGEWYTNEPIIQNYETPDNDISSIENEIYEEDENSEEEKEDDLSIS
jgi:hypothetical protein